MFGIHVTISHFPDFRKSLSKKIKIMVYIGYFWHSQFLLCNISKFNTGLACSMYKFNIIIAFILVHVELLQAYPLFKNYWNLFEFSNFFSHFPFELKPNPTLSNADSMEVKSVFWFLLWLISFFSTVICSLLPVSNRIVN